MKKKNVRHLVLYCILALWIGACQKKTEKKYHIEYYANGKKQREGYMMNDRPIGKWMFYWENGNLRKVKNYTRHTKFRNIATGEVYNYHYQNGNLRYEVFHNREGNEEGILKGYREDGKTLRELYHYKDHRLHGIVKAWNKEGKLSSHEMYAMGTLIHSFVAQKTDSSLVVKKMLQIIE